MKNVLHCGAGRTHNQEVSPLNRNSEFTNLMNYFWNYMDLPTNVTENAALAEWEPRLQIVETKEAVMVTAELPGIAEEDLDLQVSSDGYLSISGEKKNASEKTEKDTYFSEISYGSFKRTIPLPWDLDYDKVSARFNNGVLSVYIPKSQDEKQKFKKISINQNTEHN